MSRGVRTTRRRAWVSSLLIAGAAGPAQAGEQRPGSRVCWGDAVGFELGAQGFLRGDSLEVSELCGDRPQLEVGGHYRVRGRYRLGSRADAQVAVYMTEGEVGGANAWQVSRGTGAFELSFEVLRLGQAHVSFYPREPRAEGFGGLYFGQGEHLLRSAPWYERLNGLERPPEKR